MALKNTIPEVDIFCVPHTLRNGRWEPKPGHELAATINQCAWAPGKARSTCFLGGRNER